MFQWAIILERKASDLYFNMRIVSLFDFSGNMVRPWAEAGHTCLCCDIRHPKGFVDSSSSTFREEKEEFASGGSITKLHWNALLDNYLDNNTPSSVDIVFAFPPCDHLAVSGARWFKGKGLRKLAEAIEMVALSAEYAQYATKFSMIENPISTLSTYWRKPDYIFDPCDYGDPYTKKTCLWTGGDFVMPEKNRVEPTLGSKMHLLPPSADRANLRSETPMGFAHAVFEANK